MIKGKISVVMLAPVSMVSIGNATAADPVKVMVNVPRRRLRELRGNDRGRRC